MDDLTIFLILSGIVLIILIAVFTHFKNKKKASDEVNGFSIHNNSIDDVLLLEQKSKQESKQKSKQKTALFSGKENLDSSDLPQSFATNDEWVDNTRPAKVVSSKIPEQTISISQMSLPEGISDLVIVMSIQRDNHAFSGDEILNACKANNMVYGKMDIFHFPADKKQNTYALFSMANMVEPGTFDLDNMESFSTPGLSLFIQLPLPINCIEAYKKFVEQAKKLSKSLNADLYDEKFNIFSQQIMSHNLENINAFQRELMTAKKKQA